MPLLFILLLAGIVNFSSPIQAQENNTQIRGPRDSDTLAQQRTIGPLSGSDTLWRVAEKIKPDGNVSLYQVMYALYLKNPDAFIDGNLNHLKPGSTLLVPTLREVRQVDADTARNKSEQDDRTWAQRQKAATARQEQPATPPAWQTELQRLDSQQKQDLDTLRTQFGDSIQRVEAVAAENQQLRASLDALQQELELLKQQLGEDSELQQQIQLLLAQQAELLAQQANEQRQQQEQFDWSTMWSNPLSWIIAACVPALLILFSVLLWVKKRSKKTEDVISAATTEPAVDPNYKSPLPPLDDDNDLDESLFELDDALLDEAFQDTGDFSSDELEDDSLPALDDELSFEDDTISDDSLLPAAELSNDDDMLLEDETDLLNEDTDEPSQNSDPDNLLSDADLTALLAAEDEDDNIIELAEDDGGLGDDDFAEDADDILLAEDNEQAADALTVSDSQDEDVVILEDAPLEQDDNPDTAPGDAEFDLSDISDEEPEADEAFSADDLIEEIELDLPADDENDVDIEQQQITAALAELESLSPSEPVVTDEPPLPEDAGNDPDEQFDSTELDAFAESLAQENAALEDENDLDNTDAEDAVTEDTESLLSAELAELLEQVESDSKDANTLSSETEQEPEAPAISEPNAEHSEQLNDELNSDDLTIEQTELSQPDSDDVGIEDVDIDVVAEAEAEADEDVLAELLDDDADADEKSAPAPDLTLSDDGSVSRLSEAALSVENPSKILEQYPELELSDDDVLAEFDHDNAEELASDDNVTITAADAEIELDPLADQQFDELMNELEAMAGKISHPDDVNLEPVQFIDRNSTEDDSAFDLSDDDFVEIDKLLSGTDSADLDPERFNQLNVDVGLDEFADIIGEHEQRDVDSEDNGFAAKLDLVRAYIEIEDQESADRLIDDILQSDAPEHVKTEAQTLKSDS